MQGLSEYWRQWTPWQQSALIGAGITGGLSSPYVGLLNVCCCLGVLFGAIVAVQQYSSRSSAVVPSGEGALLGMTSGVGGAIFASLIEVGMRIIGIGVRGAVEQALQMFPASVEETQDLSRWQGQWEVLWVVGEMAAKILVFAVFGAIGGAIGVALLGTDTPRVDPRVDSSGPTSQEGASDDGAASKRDGSV